MHKIINFLYLLKVISWNSSSRLGRILTKTWGSSLSSHLSKAGAINTSVTLETSITEVSSRCILLSSPCEDKAPLTCNLGGGENWEYS